MTTRRTFLTAMIATGLAPAASWADAGSPTHLAAARTPDGRFVLCGLDGARAIVFVLPLPGRGHAGAAHPHRPEAVAFARRPGTFALVLDCRTGEAQARLTAPPGRHFYGHGTFSGDGGFLFTTENDFEAANGRIGIWDANRAYRRIGEIPSGGVGPHDVLALPGADVLAVANGGIETHPDSGRAKLNLPTMRPNLSYLSFKGDLLDRVEPPREAHLNSIRHLSVRADGLVAFATQWQGGMVEVPSLLGLHRPGQAARYLIADPAYHASLAGYAGSVSFSGDGQNVAVTAPRNGVAMDFNVADGSLSYVAQSIDICGVSPMGRGFLFSTGTGEVFRTGEGSERFLVNLNWDNHIVRVT